MVQGADVVWIIRCSGCEHRVLSRWWAPPSEAAAPPQWGCENCGDLDFHFAAISWHDLHRVRGGPDEGR
jgi:hypothetical protein